MHLPLGSAGAQSSRAWWRQSPPGAGTHTPPRRLHLLHRVHVRYTGLVIRKLAFFLLNVLFSRSEHVHSSRSISLILLLHGFCHTNALQHLYPPRLALRVWKSDVSRLSWGARPLTSWAPSRPTVSASALTQTSSLLVAAPAPEAWTLRIPAAGITSVLSSLASVLAPLTTPQPHRDGSPVPPVQSSPTCPLPQILTGQYSPPGSHSGIHAHPQNWGAPSPLCCSPREQR